MQQLQRLTAQAESQPRREDPKAGRVRSRSAQGLAAASTLLLAG